MKTIQLAILISTAAVSAFAQQWEFGGTAGAGFLPGVPVTSSVGSATTGFKTGPAFGVFVGQNLYPHLSGEIHYGFMLNNLKLSSGGTEATFPAQARLLYYDLIFHTPHSGSRTQLFAAVGGGAKIFLGTGKEQAYQPLTQFGYFTKTRPIKPMASV